MAKDSITRTITFPADLYEVLKQQAKLEELSIATLIIRQLRKDFNVPVKI